MAAATARLGQGTNEEAIAELSQAALRLGGFSSCFFLRLEADGLVEWPSRADSLKLPLEGSFSGVCVRGARARVADADEDVLHQRERTRLRRDGSDYWLAVPVLIDRRDETCDGLVVGLKKAPLSADTGELERTVLAMVAGQLALHQRLADAEGASNTARTKAREQEGETEGLLQALRTATVLLEPDNTLHDANRAAELLFGFQTTAARGQPLGQVFQQPEVVEILQQVSSTGGGEPPEISFGEEQQAVLEIRVTPIFDSRGELLRKVVVFTDTSLLRQTDQLKTQFVSMISHELRTPLTSIKAFAATLLHDDVGTIEDQREWLQIIDRECDRLAALIGDLLTISRIETGQPLAMQFSECELRPLLEAVVEAARSLATRHTFVIEAPETLSLEADCEKLRQVCNNLVTNAVKYSPRGGQVVVTLAERGAEIEIRVADEGVGIRAEHQNLIFEKFFQVDGGSTRRVGGTGLGLYLTKRLVEAHDGRIWVESEPGVGSVFVVVLPRRRHVRDRLGTSG